MFTSVSGSLASVLANVDQANAELAQNVMLLKRMKSEYKLDPYVYKEISRFLNFNNSMALTKLANFVESLPTTLRVAVVMQIYKDMFSTHPFFLEMQNKRLFAFLGQRLR